MGANQILVGIDQHAFDDVLFIDVKPIGLAQHRGQRGGAATEIGFLFDDVAEFAFAYALHRFVDQHAARQGGDGHLRCFGRAGQTEQQGNGSDTHDQYA